MQRFGALRRLPGTMEDPEMMEDRAGSTTAWAIAFLVLALMMTLAGVAALALGTTFS